MRVRKIEGAVAGLQEPVIMLGSPAALSSWYFQELYL